MSNIIENRFINKKNKRNEEKNEINQKNKKSQIFLIKKVRDKTKEIEKDRIKSIFRKSKFRGVSRKGNRWQALIMINRKKIILVILNQKKKQLKFMMNMQ